ncbi:addiction module antidote protein [uncultured Sphaerotilus sp.]|jgi:probable addiction module antidote protein|uniref:addiction module antidote protein n=1 Tax=uncultured Sphaerotilus sp. TaxID=474984 RepID=UPI0030CA4912
MTKIADLPDFDMADYLTDDEAVAQYLSVVLAEGDAGELADALGHIAKARGMAQIAKDSGLGREALYKALRPGAQPRFDTINRVCAALGVRLVAVPVNAG